MSADHAGVGVNPVDRTLSEYAVAFAFLADLATARTESEAVERIFDLVTTLCAPGRVVFIADGASDERRTSVRPPEAIAEAVHPLAEHEQWAIAPSGGGFALRIRDIDGSLGVLHIHELAHPDRLKDYLNLTLGMVGVCALAIRNARNHERLANTLADLQHTMAELKTLRGLLPICAWCKRIRDDSGAWSQVEEYVTQHSDAVFSHSICPSCMQNVHGIEPPQT